MILAGATTTTTVHNNKRMRRTGLELFGGEDSNRFDLFVFSLSLNGIGKIEEDDGRANVKRQS